MVLNEKYQKIIKNICKTVFENAQVEVVLYGSRARNTPREGSDIDLAVISNCDLQSEVSKFRERLDESTLPYMIDVIELRDVSEPFKENIERDGVVIWKN
jgi:predicted nucleotidyltransferase